MKLFHLSDLHIGKRVHEFSMIEDQKYMLTQILQAVMREKPDGVLISGDVYDRTIPTAEAVQVLDAFLTSLSEQEVPVFIISGNHDSAERLAFGSNLMGKSGIYLSKVYDGRIEKFALQDAYGTVWIHLLPFLRPSTVRHALPERAEEIQSTAGREGGTGADPNRSRRAEYPFSASVCDRRAAVRGRGTAGR